MAHKGVAIQMKDLLYDVSKEVEEAVQKALKTVPRATAQKLRNESPKRSGKYASGWTVKQDKRTGAIVYNKNKPRLTHLLERGHVARNKYGTYGRARARPHIKPAEEWASSEFQDTIMRNLT